MRPDPLHWSRLILVHFRDEVESGAAFINLTNWVLTSWRGILYHSYATRRQRMACMPIWLEVNPRSGVPLYVQLVEQIKRAVHVGILRPGESMPTVRRLSAELHIALNTIVKAYAELESLGIIETRGGAGTVIRPGVGEVLRPEAVDQLRERLHALANDAAALEVSEGDLRAWIDAELRRVFWPHDHEG
jgi:GntR family transcriptional regulator